MNFNLKIIFFYSLICEIKSNFSADDSDFWDNNIWLIILLIVFSIALIILIILVTIKICKKCKIKNNKINNNENQKNFVNTERETQKYSSDYVNNSQNSTKLKYKQRPSKDFEN